MKKAHLLLRVSTSAQAKAGTIEAQRPPVRALALRLGVADADIIEHKEEAVSGAASLNERDGLLRLLAAANAGDLVVAYDLSRLTRSDDWESRYVVLGRLRTAQLRVATVEDGEIDLDTVSGRITTHIRAEIAADERKKIRDRTMNGKRNAAREGRKPQGKTPYGWTYDKTTRAWSLVEAEAAIRRELVQRVAAGETTGRVAEDFKRRDVVYPARTGAQAGWTPRRVWHFATASINKGEWNFDGVMIAVPPLVDAETFARVQVALSKNQERGRRRTRHVYMLDEEHGRCALCDAPLRIQWGNSGNDAPYYVCARRLLEKSCALPWWRVDEADTLVWGECKQVLERPDLVEEALRERVAETTDDGGLAAMDIAAGEKQLNDLANVRGVLIEQGAKGNIPPDELARYLEDNARKSRLIGQTVAAAREQAETARAVVAEIGSVRAWLVRVRGELDLADEAERRRICRGLAVSVKLDEACVRIGLKLRTPGVVTFVGGTCS